MRQTGPAVRHLPRKAKNCLCSTLIWLTTRFARDTEVTEENELLMCRETTAHQNHHACGALVNTPLARRAEVFSLAAVSRPGKRISSSASLASLR